MVKKVYSYTGTFVLFVSWSAIKSYMYNACTHLHWVHVPVYTLYVYMYIKIHVYSTLAKLVIKKENSDPIHPTQTVQTCKHTMTRTPGLPALRTGMVGFKM